MFDIKIDSDNGRVLGEIIVDSYFFDKSKYDYAFYLYRNNERIDLEWYSNSMSVIFNVEDTFGDFYIKAYIRDIAYGDKRAFSSNVLAIKN